MSAVAPELHHGVVEGLETFWTGGAPTRPRATLLFRAGMADETHATHGIAHLAEHLYHGELTYPGALETNASTGTLLTSFDFRGPSEDIAAALTRLIERINSGVGDGLALKERDVLRAEAQQRGADVLTDTLFQRWGLRAVAGSADRDELFLDDPDETLLREFAARHYARGNAVLVIEGEPLQLGVALREGPSVPVPPLPEGAVLEACARDTLTVSGLVSATDDELELSCGVLEWTLTQRLRGELGRSYGAVVAAFPVAAGRAVIAAGGEVIRWDEEVWERVIGTIDELADRGADEELVAALRERRESEFTDPASAFGMARRAAGRRLLGDPLATPHQMLADLRSLDGASLAPIFAQFRSSLLVGCPEPSITQPRLAVRAYREPPRSAALRWRTPMWPANSRQFVVDDEAFGLYDETTAIGMRWAEVVEFHNDSNGMLTFYDIRGDGLRVNPTVWRKGDSLIAELRRRAAGLEGIGRRELDSPPLPVPERIYPYDRLMAQVHGHTKWRWPILLGLWSIFALLIVGIVYLVVTGAFPLHLAAVLIGTFVAVPVAGYFQDRRRVRKLTGKPR